MKTAGRLLTIVVLAALAGCTVRPHYVRPHRSRHHLGSGSTTWGTRGESIDLGWRESFGDPQLPRFMAQAAAANHDLHIAEARVGEA
jgi:outer membrane protein TolC